MRSPRSEGRFSRRGSPSAPSPGSYFRIATSKSCSRPPTPSAAASPTSTASSCPCLRRGLRRCTRSSSWRSSASSSPFRFSQRAGGRWQPLPSPLQAPAGRPRCSADEQTVAMGALALAAALSTPLILRVRSSGSLVAGIAASVLVVAGAAWASSATSRRPRGRRELAELGLLGGGREGHGCQIRVGLELRRDRVSGDEDRRPHGRGARTSTVLAHLDARPLRERPLVRGSALALTRGRRVGRDPARPARAPTCGARGELARAAGRGQGARRRSPGGRRHAGCARLAAARHRVPPVRRRSARSQPAGRGTELPRVELRARPGSRGARGVEAAIPDRRKALSRRRRSTVSRVRRPRPRRPRARAVLDARPRLLRRLCVAVPGRAPDRRVSRQSLCGGSRPRVVVQAPRRLRLRRAAAARGRPAARRLREDDESGVLPALRGRDGGDAADARDPRSGRGRLHERAARRREVGRHRPRGARVGRSLVRGAGLGSVRSDSGAGDVRQHLLVRVGLGGCRRGAPSR